MTEEKLKEIGQKLGVTEKDIRKLRRKGISRNLLYWIIGILVAILSFLAGFFIGRGTCPPAGGGGYPFAAAVIPGIASGKKKSRVAILLISAIAFLLALKGTPVFGQAIKYNVYKR